MKTESGCLILRAKGGYFKKRGEPVFIKSQGIEQELETKISTILNKKAKTERFFYIKNREKVPNVDYNKKIYYSIKCQNGELVSY